LKEKRVPYEVPDNVASFIDRAAVLYGHLKCDEFSDFMWMACRENVESPIEQLFMVAINLVAEFNLVRLSIAGTFDDRTDDLLVIPQWQIGTYRADFALRQHPIDKIVVVELDGHEFHDRDERQRRYEKRRDRFFTASGYSVLHFTGSEIVKDPCAGALEAFILATGNKGALHPLEER
jgi:very-short-patch-repair endonuclease